MSTLPFSTLGLWVERFCEERSQRRKIFGLGKIFGALVTCTSARAGGRN